MTECKNCQQSIDSEDRFCRNCGASVSEAPVGRFKPFFPPSEQREDYWPNYVRPFITAAVLLSAGLALLALAVKGISLLLAK